MGTGTSAHFAGKIAAQKHRAKTDAKEAEKTAKNLNKEFDYYCPHCLYQTNEYTKLCPRCRSKRLEKTYTDNKESTDWKKRY